MHISNLLFILLCTAFGGGKLLTTKIPVNPVVFYRLLKTDERERSGKIALRGALVTAALDKQEGLTLLNFLRNLSVDVQIDVQKAIALAKDIGIIVDGTEKFVAEVARLSAQEAQQSANVDFDQLPDLRQPGKFAFAEKTWKIYTIKKNYRKCDEYVSYLFHFFHKYEVIIPG